MTHPPAFDLLALAVSRITHSSFSNALYRDFVVVSECVVGIITRHALDSEYPNALCKGRGLYLTI